MKITKILQNRIPVVALLMAAGCPSSPPALEPISNKIPDPDVHENDGTLVFSVAGTSKIDSSNIAPGHWEDTQALASGVKLLPALSDCSGVVRDNVRAWIAKTGLSEIKAQLSPGRVAVYFDGHKGTFKVLYRFDPSIAVASISLRRLEADGTSAEPPAELEPLKKVLMAAFRCTG